MTESYAGILYKNTNHSHPEYPERCKEGELCLYDNGIVFAFDDQRLKPLVIPWKNVQSTYPSVQGHPNGFFQAAWYLSVYGTVATMLTFGEVALLVGSLSIKYKEAALDKIIVSEFLNPGIIRFLGKRWANEVDEKIWQYKTNERWSNNG